MPEPTVDPTLSIDRAFDSGYQDDAKVNPPDGSSGEHSQADADKSGQDGVPPKDGDNGDEEEDKAGDPPDNASPPATDEVVDPDKGTFKGEYTEKRFNGLMKQWQEDRQERVRLEKEIARLSGQKPPEQKVEAPAEIELPDELKTAEPEAQAGYRLLMKGVNAKVDAIQKQILAQVLEKVTEPQRKENEQATFVAREKQELATEFGNKFTENEKAILEYAVENEYPLGSLRQATRAFFEIQKLTGGRKTIDTITKEKEKEASLPGTGKNRVNVIPKFDPKRDGEKSIDQLFDEGMKA